MKTWLTTFLFLISIYCHGQFYESSGNLSSNGISGPARGYYSGNTSVNFRGSIFHFYGKDICMSCGMDLTFYKSSTSGYSTTVPFPYNLSGTTDNVTGFEDQHGNTYMQWETDYIGNLGGGLYNITGGYSSTLFKYDHNTLKWIIDFELSNTLYADMDDNIYVQYSNKVKKYDSTGVLVDSMLFTTQTQPAFMDSLGSFYRYKNDSLIKFDFTGNTIWSIYLPGSAVNYSMQGPEIFTSTAAAINMVSLSGNVTTYPNAAGAPVYQYDANGNYYQGPSKKYNINTGVVYNDTTVHFSSAIMDRTGRFYSYGYRDFSNVSTAVTFNLPPDVFRIIGPINTVYWGEWFTWYQVFNTDNVNKNINIGLNSYGINGFCSGGPAYSNVEFTVDNYPPSLSYLGFNVELSDSAGSFTTPLLLGVTTTNKLNFICPPNIIPGSNYRVRVTPNIQGYTVSNNISAPFRVRSTPTATINFTNAVYITPSYYGVGFCDSIFLSSQTNANSPSYLWQTGWNNGNNTYLFTTDGTTPSLYIKQSKDITQLTVTDTNGCYNVALIDLRKLYYNTYAISYYDTVNANNVHQVGLNYRYNYNTDTIWGNHVTKTGSYYYFNVDSAGPGWHYIYAAFPQQSVVGLPLCGNDTLVDSVYVYGFATAMLTAGTSTQLCTGDTAVAIITLAGTAPFTFYLKENNVRIGPFTTSQNTYTYKKTIAGAGSVTLKMDSVADANGSNFSSATGTTGFMFTNTVVPQVVATGPTTFCVGDSVRLSRSLNFPLYTYVWMRNGVVIPAAPSIYYAKSAGNYSVNASYLGCARNTNVVTVTVPCAPPVGGSNDKQGNGINDNTAIDNTNAQPSILFAANQSLLLITCPEEFTLQGITVYDMSGRLIDKMNDSKKATIEFSYKLPTLSNGVYMVQVLCDNKYMSKKIMVSNSKN